MRGKGWMVAEQRRDERRACARARYLRGAESTIIMVVGTGEAKSLRFESLGHNDPTISSSVIRTSKISSKKNNLKKNHDGLVTHKGKLVSDGGQYVLGKDNTVAKIRGNQAVMRHKTTNNRKDFPATQAHHTSIFLL